MSPRARATEPPRPLRVVTFNLFHGGPSSGLVGDGEALEERLDPRVLLRADVRTPWGELAVFSTHVSRDDCQVARVGEIVREHAKGQPAVLMGDFNAGETSMAIQALNGNGGFVDAFRAANPDAPGLTVWQQPGAPESTVRRRIDYILVAGGPGADVACSSRVVLHQPRRSADGRTLWPSDHYGVLAELRLFGIQCAP